MKIVANYHTHTSCSYHRVLLPMRYFQLNDGDSLKLITEQDSCTDEDFDCDILLINRVPTLSMNYILDLKKRYGFKLVVDMDDHWILHHNHPAYNEWKKQDMSKQLMHNMMVADMVTVTNEALLGAATLLNRNTHILPNALPFGYEQFKPGNTPHVKTRVMYAGGSSHLADLKTITALFKRLGADSYFRERAHFILAGHSHKFGVGAINSEWLKMEAIIKPVKDYLLLKELPLHEYMNCYNFADISIAPLDNTFFNSCKSNLKTLEAGCKKIPLVASKVAPYTTDGTEGLVLCDNVADWHTWIRKLTKEKSMREDMGNSLFEYVTTRYSLPKVNELRRQLFESLISK